MRLTFFPLLFGLAWSSSAYSTDARGLSESEARAILVDEVQLGALVAYKGIHIDFDAGAQIFGRDFYSYAAQNLDHKDSIDTLGYFAVNKRTGAIWDAWACKPVRSKFDPPIIKRIRNSLGRSAYLKLYKERPVCFND